MLLLEVVVLIVADRKDARTRITSAYWIIYNLSLYNRGPQGNTRKLEIIFEIVTRHLYI